MPAAGARAGILENLLDIARYGPQARNKAEDKRRHKCDKHCPAEHLRVDVLRTQQWKGYRRLVCQPREQRHAKSQTAEGSSTGEDKTLHKKLAHDAAAAGAEGTTNGELASAGGSARQKQVGEIHAGDQKYDTDRRPQYDERTVQLTGDIFLERDGNKIALVTAASIGKPGGEIDVGGHAVGVVACLGNGDAGLEPAHKGHNVAPCSLFLLVERRE